MSFHTELSLCHTFLPSLTQSMLGGMVSRATKRHLSLTTVQNAEMEDISLLLRCGCCGAYGFDRKQNKATETTLEAKKKVWRGAAGKCSWMTAGRRYGWNGRWTLPTSNCSSSNFAALQCRVWCDAGLLGVETAPWVSLLSDKWTKLPHTYSVN